MQQLKVFGLTFKGLTREQIFAPHDGCRLIVTVNADFIVRANEQDQRLAEIINCHTSTFDGMWPFQIARRKFPDIRIEKISGSDLIYQLAERCVASSGTLLLVGGAPASAAGAQANLNRRYCKDFCRAWSPDFEKYPYSARFVEQFQSLVRQHKPKVIAFCLGSPSQEYFAQDQLAFMTNEGVEYCIGAGGTVDFLSGKLKRAPALVQVIGLEGLWRLMTQPSLFRIQRLLRSVRVFRFMYR
ncbi:WecB/TagA/CpsF family glycosyltransferase [Azohydromonas aeria]|uniref:WecB/TagA/CpsF family glycosyltransferase n=1 Tax=Azohydromonas aeria TaxID=2590212 RepID=UPI0012F9309A|nr:WecB/TagA/CpsF family glycosyltransferase [Azohydromonas aeria]